MECDTLSAVVSMSYNIYPNIFLRIGNRANVCEKYADVDKNFVTAHILLLLTKYNNIFNDKLQHALYIIFTNC